MVTISHECYYNEFKRGNDSQNIFSDLFVINVLTDSQVYICSKSRYIKIFEISKSSIQHWNIFF